MPRSAVLTGRIDARDRAKVRARRDRQRLPVPDASATLNDWLENVLDDVDVGQMDLNAFLSDTQHIDLPPHERLRLLAIANELGAQPFALDRVYEAALRLAPDDMRVWRSRGISMEYFACVADEPASVARFSKLALQYLHRALELEADDATAAHVIGICHYNYGGDGPAPVREALSWFERALEKGGHDGFAALYRAHCLHDLELWAPAVDAYEAVPLNAFDGPTAWRVDTVLEGQAWCRLQAGDRQGALRDFSRLLSRIEKEPHRALPLFLTYLSRASRGELNAELGERFTALCKTVDIVSLD